MWGLWENKLNRQPAFVYTWIAVTLAFLKFKFSFIMRFLFTFLVSIAVVTSMQAQGIFHPDIVKLAGETESQFPLG